MNIERYNTIHEELINRLDNGVITVEFYKEVNDLAFEEYIMESTEKRIERNKLEFMKKYKYNPEDKTIIVDGEKFKVDMDIDKSLIELYGPYGIKQPAYRQTQAEIMSKDSTIHLDKQFFMVNRESNRDAILLHEIGHIKLHTMNPNSKNFNKNSISKKVWNDMLLTMAKEACKRNNITDEKTIQKLYKQLKILLAPYYLKYTVSNLSLAKRQARYAAYELAKKYELENNSHCKSIEIEADRWAANRTSEKDMKQGLKKIYKAYYGRKKLSKEAKDDYTQRIKALKDKELKENELYK